MDNESYQAGWQWAQDRLFDYTPAQIRHDAEGTSCEFDEPDAFYEGALDRIEKETDRLR